MPRSDLEGPESPGVLPPLAHPLAPQELQDRSGFNEKLVPSLGWQPGFQPFPGKGSSQERVFNVVSGLGFYAAGVFK